MTGRWGAGQSSDAAGEGLPLERGRLYVFRSFLSLSHDRLSEQLLLERHASSRLRSGELLPHPSSDATGPGHVSHVPRIPDMQSITSSPSTRRTTSSPFTSHTISRSSISRTISSPFRRRITTKCGRIFRPASPMNTPTSLLPVTSTRHRISRSAGTAHSIR